MPPSGTTMTTNSVPRNTREDYHKEALHQIRASLQPFAHGGPRERLSPVVCSSAVGGDWSPAPPPRHAPPPSSSHHHYHQPPSPHHHHHQSTATTTSTQHYSSYDTSSAAAATTLTTNTVTPHYPLAHHHHHHHQQPHLSSHTGPPAPAPPSSSSSVAVASSQHLQAGNRSSTTSQSSLESAAVVTAVRHYAYEPAPPPRPPAPPPPSSPPPPTQPNSSQMPPILSRLSPAPNKCKGPTPNYVNVSAGGAMGGSSRPMLVSHSAVGPQAATTMGPPPPYPIQGKPVKVPPPPYQSRQSPTVDRTSPGPMGPTPPPLLGGGSLGPVAMTVPMQQQQQQQSSYGQGARQAKTPTPVIMQSVRSTQVQKPVLQNAVAPPSPPPTVTTQPSLHHHHNQNTSTQSSSLSSCSSTSTLAASTTTTPPPPPPPPYTPTPSSTSASSPYTLPPSSPYTIASSSPYTLPSVSNSPSPGTPPVPLLESPVPLFDPPSYKSTMQAKAAAARAYISYSTNNPPYTSSSAANYTSYATNSPYTNVNSNRQAYRGCISPALACIPVQETLVQELDLSSTPLAQIPIDTVSESGNINLNSSNYNDCDSGGGAAVVSAATARMSRLLAATPDTTSTESPRSASPVSSVTSHDTHALSPSPVSCLSTATSSPSTQSDMTLESGYSSSSQSVARGMMAPPPPPPSALPRSSIVAGLRANTATNLSNKNNPNLARVNNASIARSTPSNNNNNNNNNNTLTQSDPSGNTTTNMPPPASPPPNLHKTMHHSPIPERKKKPTQEIENGPPESKIKYTPEAYKFYIEQHVENIIKNAKERKHREMQLEKEMKKIGLSSKDQLEMRKVLCQKESNHIRLKRAKMNKSMFEQIKTIGVGAFGEVALVRKTDGAKLYAMKTLRKSDVLKRNQVAHVKAERDILAESDNDWVVKLYYSFQDSDNLYLIMDYIPGGDLMSLLIKFGIFKEPLAKFYIAELVCAIESVHMMGFIHRDIKPDNILIDSDGHIKLTDFGLCTGFRWTHNSRYYQRKGDHARQESMDPCGDNDMECRCDDLKPLERRWRRQHLRCMAHSLVGTPNYIAPEVLSRTGYTQLCDWWSVGVILYEMLMGQPPFLANTPAETQHKVLHYETSLRIPKQANMSNEARDIIMRLCSGPETRLGRRSHEIKSHSFFAEIDFDAGLRKQQALYIPEIKHSTDTSNFDPIEPDRLRSESDSDGDWVNSNQPIHGFYEFTFRRFFDSTPSTGGLAGNIANSAALAAVAGAAGVTGNGGATAASTDEKDGQNPVYV